jgi:hypothetical protein
VAGTKGELIPKVDDGGPGITMASKLVDGESVQSRNAVERAGTRRIELFHSAIVGREGWYVRQDSIHELLLGQVWIEIRVSDALEAQSRVGPAAHPRSAHRPGSVPRKDLEPIRQSRQPGAHAVEHAPCESDLRLFAQEIGATEGSDEEKVAGQHGDRSRHATGSVEDQEGEVLRGVSGSVERLDLHLAEGDRVSLLEGGVVERHLVQFTLVVGGQQKFGADPARQFLGSRGEVGVDVGLQDMGDGESRVPGPVEVDIDVAARIHDGHLAGPFATHRIGVLR